MGRSKTENDKKEDKEKKVKDNPKRSKDRKHSGKGKKQDVPDGDVRSEKRKSRNMSDEMERDGDWHCGRETCRFVNFKNNLSCKNCRADKPDPPVFWDREKCGIRPRKRSRRRK